MKNKKTNYNSTFLSNQTKQALYYAFLEAKNCNSNIVTSKFILYGILKVSPSLLNNVYMKVVDENGVLNQNKNYYLNKCKIALRNQTIQNVSEDDSKKIILSKSARDLFKSLISDLKIENSTPGYYKKNYTILTTFLILNQLLKNENLKTWFKNEIFLPEE